MNSLTSSDPGNKKLEVPPIPEELKVITVEIISHGGSDAVCLHGERVKIGAIVKVTIQQWKALSRFFRWIDGPAELAPASWEPKPATT